MKVHEGSHDACMNTYDKNWMLYDKNWMLSIWNNLGKNTVIKCKEDLNKKSPKPEISKTHFGEEKETK